MRIFHCDRCGAAVPFATQRCGSCDAPLAYDFAARAMRVLHETANPAVYRIDGGALVWRCLNSAWGCNWMTAASAGSEWCPSCRLTRGRPDTARGDAIDAWVAAEAVKRWLLHQLHGLGLPIEERSPAAPSGLAFDFVHLPGGRGLTGHLDGVVTLDLAEVDDGLRDDLRRRLGEPVRSVIGHLRHEAGHYYWRRLAGRTGGIDEFRRLFGDETIDYRQAIARYYATTAPTWDHTRHVTPYAASHPLEDWAETFAHYLHVLDATETALAHDLVPHDLAPAEQADPCQRRDLASTLDTWRRVNGALDAIATSLGAAPLYPFDLTGHVVDKLGFVHQQVRVIAGADRP